MPDPRQIERAWHDAEQSSEHRRTVWRLPYFRLASRRRRAEQGGSSKSAAWPRPHGSDCTR